MTTEAKTTEPKNAIVAVTRTVPGPLEIDAGPGVAIDVRTGTDDQMPEGELCAFVRGASVIVSMFSDRIDAPLLDAAGPQLRGVCNFAVGYNNIDLDACRERGVAVTNTPNAVTEGTADLAWALILAVARRVVEGDAFARSGAWAARGTLGMSEFMGVDLTGRTLLIVGAGRIGFATAMRSVGWGMRVLYTARSRHWDFELAPLAAERVSLEDGLSRADVVSVHTPLTPETAHLIDAAALRRMKANAILVNTSRGPVVDEAALAEALREKRIWGAGLDVFEREPEVHDGLKGLSNVVMTPHIGSAERKYREMMTAMVGENAGAILRGDEVPNRVA
ncbi:MAG: D-glycerate dehydrogenase [Phycisphaerales bacterium]|nr:MAG: D-glycerate dehydrogenase [Phycisphaerales bacterium]